MGTPQIEPRNQHAIDVHTAADRVHLPQGLHEQARADEQCERQRYLQRDERAPRVALSRRTAGARVLERLPWIGLHSTQCGKDAEEHAGQERESEPPWE